MSREGDEFDIIARHFAPLARTPAARGLLDDAALLDDSGPYVVTADAIVEGVHFLPNDPIDAIAQKALRVNVSDIVAKGAAPSHYLLTLQWPRTRPTSDLALFAEGLARDQATFGCTMLGGDTTSTTGPLAVSVTMFGRPLGATPSRAGAQIGDDLWVTGTIGDGVLGLRVLAGKLPHVAVENAAWLTERYRRPQPRIGLAATVAAFATASMDVSDGLLGDAAKLARVSGVAISIDPVGVPLSRAATSWLETEADRRAGLAVLLNGGDDYEVLFTAPAAERGRLAEAADDAGVALSRIGQVSAGAGLDSGGLPVGGFVHRIGA